MAVRLRLKELPEAVRKTAIEEMQSGADPPCSGEAAKTPTNISLRLNLTKRMLAKLTEAG